VQNPTPPSQPQDIVPVAQASAPIAAPLPPEPPVEAVALASPAPDSAPVETPKTDPTVVIQPPRPERSAEIPPPAPPAKIESAAPLPQKKVARAPVVAPAPQPVPAAVKTTTVAGKAYFVQAGAFNTEAGAGKAVSGLETLGARVMPGNAADGHAVYRVRIGAFLNRQQASIAVGEAQALGRGDVIIVAE